MSRGEEYDERRDLRGRVKKKYYAKFSGEQISR